MGLSHFICSHSPAASSTNQLSKTLTFDLSVESELHTSEQARQATSEKSLSQVEGQVKWKLTEETVQVTNLTHLVLCKDRWACSDNLPSQRHCGAWDNMLQPAGHQCSSSSPHHCPCSTLSPALCPAQLRHCELCSISFVLNQSKARYPWRASRPLLFVCCYQHYQSHRSQLHQEEKKKSKWDELLTELLRVEEALKILESNHFSDI